MVPHSLVTAFGPRSIRSTLCLRGSERKLHMVVMVVIRFTSAAHPLLRALSFEDRCGPEDLAILSEKGGLGMMLSLADVRRVDEQPLPAALHLQHESAH